jgi:acetyl-CoA carboxylase alpha subunit
MANTLKNWVLRSIRDVARYQTDALIQKRFEKFRSMGMIKETDNSGLQASGLNAG